MMRTAMLALLLIVGPTFAADWQPVKGPLMTRWAKDVSPDKVHPEYPRPQLVRKDWLNLNGLWQLAFAKDKEEPTFGKDLPERILVPFPVESALSGVMKRADRLWYRRTFAVPQSWSGKRVLLHFGAVDWEATVWVNGTKLGTHKGGYDPFSFDITDALKSQGEQELVVGVWDPTDAGTQPRGKQVNRPQGIYYTPSTGIWQTVWLEAVTAAHIDSLKIVPDDKKASVKVNVKGGTDKHTIKISALWDKTVQSGITVYGNEAAIDTNAIHDAQELKPRNAKLWSPDSPYLYDLRVQLLENDKVIDEVWSYFALRKIEIAKDDKGVNRILLNGKFVFQVGPLDQGFWPDGLYTAPTDDALKYDIEITKKLGFNMARKHVKVEPDRWYYWCDKLGLLVWQDMPSGDRSIRDNQPDLKRTPESAAQFELELKRMIDGLHNHPCIVMWVVFNEGWGQFDTERLTKWTKDYDPTRLVNCASGWTDRKVGDVHDIHVYPGPGAPPLEDKRAGVLGEFGGLGLKVDGHTWTSQTWGYRGTQDKDDLTRKYERLLARVWQLKDEAGLNAAVYTQTTDVETEANGFMTYDREVIKLDVDRATAVNKGDVSRVPQIKVVVPTSQEKGLTWRYTLEQPADGWFKADFDDKSWKEAPGGFGTRGTPGSVVRTEWKTDNIWLRREFTLPEGSLTGLQLLLHHDDDAEVYVNGVLATKLGGYTTNYEEVPISAEARGTLKPGKNHIAIHCKQIRGGQYIDAGLVQVVEKKP